MTSLAGIEDSAFDWVYAINVFHFLPHNKREKFLQEMIRISRYGIFFNQIILNTLQTIAVDVLLSTLFTDYTGFFTETEANELIRKAGSQALLLLVHHSERDPAGRDVHLRRTTPRSAGWPASLNRTGRGWEA